MTDETGADLSGARAEAERRGVGSYGRHIFICTGPDCCTPEQGRGCLDAAEARRRRTERPKR